MILAGDVGGTKCNLALFSRRMVSSKSSTASVLPAKTFSKFDLIVKEFARQAAPHLGDEKIRAAGFGVGWPGHQQPHPRDKPPLGRLTHEILADELKVCPSS